MDNNKLHKQLIIIFIIVLGFILFNIGLYNLITKNYINHYDKNMKEKSINLELYLPFKSNSLIVHEISDIKINENIPVIDGATALYPVYSSFVEALYPEETVKYNDNDFLEDSSIQKTGTTKAYEKVINGDVDIIFCAKPSQKQLEYAESKNVELEFVPIGREAFVFIVNSNNPVSNITINELKDIYAGKITNWKKIGGENRHIIPVQRAEGSGSQTAMLKFMNDEKMKKNYNVFIGQKIGYSFRYYVEGIVNDGNIKMLSLNGIYPSKENIKNESYPIVDTFCMVYRKDNKNENIEKIKEFVLSDKGQKIIEDTGYVGVK